jgi:hypothetical protein
MAILGFGICQFGIFLTMVRCGLRCFISVFLHHIDK